MGGRHRIAVLLLPPVVGFDASIAPMLFGAAVDDDGEPLYDVVVCGLDDQPVATTNGFAMLPAASPDALATRRHRGHPGNPLPVSARRRCPHATRQDRARTDPARYPNGVHLHGRVRAGRGRCARRPSSDHALEVRRCAASAASTWSTSTRTYSSSTTVRCSPPLVLPRESTCVCTSFAPTTARRSPTRSRATASCRRGEKGVRRNSSTATCPCRTTRPRRPPASGRSAGSMRKLTVERLARHAHMSQRTFNRRFREETGQAPGTWIRNRRLDHARELLESRDPARRRGGPASRGLARAANLRHHLRRGVGMSPSSYRKVYQGV